jgi:hypothetical protein
MAEVEIQHYVAAQDPRGIQPHIAVHIFPEAMRGTGEGHRPWDLMPSSTMTNATVAQMVKGVQGDEITLKSWGKEDPRCPGYDNRDLCARRQERA